jgi:hypothetical protein
MLGYVRIREADIRESVRRLRESFGADDDTARGEYP